MATTTDIVAKLWALCNVLRDDGVTYNEYVTELTYLLFLKMLQETSREERLKARHRHGQRLVQVTSFVGVMRAPNGFQIEVLPKVGKAIDGGAVEARKLLIEMLCCLRQFRHIRADNARLLAERMPLLEVFLSEFLRSVAHVVKRGLRSSYGPRKARGTVAVVSHAGGVRGIRRQAPEEAICWRLEGRCAGAQRASGPAS
jgi:hypothetical protein